MKNKWQQVTQRKSRNKQNHLILRNLLQVRVVDKLVVVQEDLGRKFPNHTQPRSRILHTESPSQAFEAWFLFFITFFLFQ